MSRRSGHESTSLACSDSAGSEHALTARRLRIFLDVHRVDLVRAAKIAVAAEPGRMDSGDRSEIVHLVHIARHPDRADHLAPRITNELTAALQEHRTISKLFQVLHEDRLLARLLQDEPRGPAERQCRVGLAVGDLE